MAETALDFTPKGTESEVNALRRLQRIAISQLGLRGCTVVSDTAAHTPTGADAFASIQAVTNIVISALAGTNITGTFTGVTIPAGMVIYGFFTSLTLTSGTAIAYNL